MVPAHKRANDIAGVCPSEAILFGLLGLDYTLKGKIIINPKQSKFSFNIYGIKFKEKTIDIIFKNGIKVYINGTILYEGELKKIVIE